MDKDRAILRPLAERVMEFAQGDEMNRRRGLWRAHNSLERTPPPIYVRAYAVKELQEVVRPRCEHPEAREIERFLRDAIYRFDNFNDDYITEPWLAVRASYRYPAEPSLRWGPRITVTRPEEERGAFLFDPPIRDEADMDKMVMPRHEIDEVQSARRLEMASEWLFGIMPAYLDRGPYFRMFANDISTDLAYLRGLEQMMWDMFDRPEWLHRLVGFMQKGIMSAQDAADAAGDYSYLNHQNQAMAYARELGDPGPECASRDRLWGYMASQEFTTISPAMWEEFLLCYQAPILNKFGLAAYGCCEDLTRKIPILKKHLPNLRRIAVTPWADLGACAKAIGDDYVLSWRPNPAHIATGLDRGFIEATAKRAFEVMRSEHCIFDITLKDVETVGGDHTAVPGWVDCVRGVIEGFEW